MRHALRFSGVVMLGALASPALAQTPIPLTISGNEAKGRIELPGGIAADLTVTFEQVVGLNSAALAASAHLASSLDLSLLSRLPASGVNLPAGFPVLLTIEPTPESALSFAGVVRISLHTHNLVLSTDIPMSLFSSHGGGPFRDITTYEGIGSYRAGGTSGGFSDFMIVVDTRPIDVVVVEKFDALQALLDEHGPGLPAAVTSTLQGRLSQARTLYEAGQAVAAIGELTAFSDYVKAQSGLTIPDVWRAHDTRVNVAGLLRSGSDTLQFSLNRESTRSP